VHRVPRRQRWPPRMPDLRSWPSGPAASPAAPATPLAGKLDLELPRSPSASAAAIHIRYGHRRHIGPTVHRVRRRDEFRDRPGSARRGETEGSDGGQRRAWGAERRARGDGRRATGERRRTPSGERRATGDGRRATGSGRHMQRRAGTGRWARRGVPTALPCRSVYRLPWATEHQRERLSSRSYWWGGAPGARSNVCPFKSNRGPATRPACHVAAQCSLRRRRTRLVDGASRSIGSTPGGPSVPRHLRPSGTPARRTFGGT
jgi:hypothetical protein